MVTAGELLPGLTFLGGDHAARRPRALQKCGFHKPSRGTAPLCPMRSETRPQQRADPMGPGQEMMSAVLGQQPEMLLKRLAGRFPSFRPALLSQPRG